MPPYLRTKEDNEESELIGHLKLEIRNLKFSTSTFAMTYPNPVATYLEMVAFALLCLLVSPHLAVG